MLGKRCCPESKKPEAAENGMFIMKRARISPRKQQPDNILSPMKHFDAERSKSYVMPEPVELNEEQPSPDSSCCGKLKRVRSVTDRT